MTKWSVRHEHDVAVADLDANGALRADVVARWIDAACHAYLDQCAALQRTRARDGLTLRVGQTAVPARAFPPQATSLVVTATATELYPASFTISVRLRAGGDTRPVNVTCDVCLDDPRTHVASELGTDIRDEVIALEHAARHFN